MNERVVELYKQALKFAYETAGVDAEKGTILASLTAGRFAELIVRECIDRVTSKANGWGDMTGFAIKESILDCAKDLKEHFGVEE